MGIQTAVSLFSGCGGFDWGVAQAGVEIVWANDVDASAAGAYQSLFSGVEFVEGDVKDVESFPEADLLIGCYPCTGFSLGSRRRWRERGETDLRDRDSNFLFREFLRALKQVEPRYLLVENVRGMLTADGGAFLEMQLEGFREAGYTVSHQLLNAEDFGVAQSRRRVFIVGVQRDLEVEFSFPQATHGGTPGLIPRCTLEDVLSKEDEAAPEDVCDYPFHGHYLTRNRKREWSEPSYTVVASERHVPLHPSGEPMEFVEKDSWRLVGDVNRRLSWRECAAIQGLPAHMELDGTLFNKYRAVGNAVPPAFGKALVDQLMTIESAF